jgi:hypothetical protein
LPRFSILLLDREQKALDHALESGKVVGVVTSQFDLPVPLGTVMTWQHLRLRGRCGWIIVVAVGLAGVWTAWPRSPRVDAAEPLAGKPAPAASSLPLQGAVSCASMACHNGFGPKGSSGSEYTTWIGGEDKHTHAYQVLFNERSQRIEKNLGNHRPATEDTLCLNCHVHPQAGSMPSETLAVIKGDGVSCESCHGAAGKWRTVHYLAGWQQKSNDQKKKFGMQPTKDLVERAKMCTGCHVGDGVRDVNHDLIAAGHPRLNFEFAAFHALMPKHWDETAEKRQYPDFEARVWMIGQLTSAEAALRLLAYRADKNAPAPEGLSKAWPEFAEYQCYACHHDLFAKSWRLDREEGLKNQPGERPKFGTLPWGTWYYPMLTYVPAGQADTLAALKQFQTEMRKSFPDRGTIADQARSLARDLEPWVRKVARAEHADGPSLTKLFGAISREGKLAEDNWDGAAQVYLALAALYHAQGDLGLRPGITRYTKHLEIMRNQLEFPESPVKYDSPEEGTYRPRETKFLEALKAISQLHK